MLWRIKEIGRIVQLKREYVWFFVILLVSHSVLYTLLTSKIEQAHSVLEAEAPDSIKASYPAPHDFIIDSLRYAIKGKFKIEVQGADNFVLSLLHNGIFVETLIPGDSGFSFEEVRLTDGENVFSVWALSAAGKSTLLDSFSFEYKSPRISYLKQPVYRHLTNNKIVAFTFDGGASNKGTVKILDILKEQQIQCTMFLTGQFIENYPDLVHRIVADGHEVGNHSYSHPHFTKLEIDGTKETRADITQTSFSRQLNETDSLFYKSSGQRMMPYWRAPFGEINREVLFWAAELGYRHIGWSYRCDSWDWVTDKKSELYRSAEDIKNYFLQMDDASGLNGKILLMHLGSERDDDFAWLSLKDLIVELKSRGYSFVRISQLLKS